MLWISNAFLASSTAVTVAVGTVAAATTIVSIIAGYGGQLLKANKSTIEQLRGLHVPAFTINALSHFVWFVYGSYCVADMVIWLPNLLGATISGAIVVVVMIRRGGEPSSNWKARTT